MVRYQSVRYNPKGKSKKYYWRCRVKYNEWQKRHRSEIPKEKLYEYDRRCRLKKFGMDESKYNEIFKSQKGKCAICGAKPDTRWKMLAVDHCHRTKKVRGLLCMTCNTMLGRLEKRFDKVMEYLGL